MQLSVRMTSIFFQQREGKKSRSLPLNGNKLYIRPPSKKL